MFVRALVLLSSALVFAACPAPDPDREPQSEGEGEEGEGEGGEGEGEGEGEEPPAPQCREACVVDDDCFLGGFDADIACIDGVCFQADPTACTIDLTCLGLFGGWNGGDGNGDGFPEDGTPCGINAPCDGDRVCVGEVLQCALPAADPACAGGDVLDVDDLDGNVVAVCVFAAGADAICEDQRCVNPCANDTECGIFRCSDARCVECNVDEDCGFRGSCRADHTCGCTSDTQCSELGLGACNVATGVCDCVVDDDCFRDPTRPVCVDGACSCNDAADCSEAQQFDGTTLSCE